jgi:UDP-3-O-[3-hydroxymyristoyl] N-acetylglucosamine deacetylase
LQKTILRTPEHLAAALLLWPNAGLAIRVLDEELPIGDGSAIPWLNGLEEVLGQPASPEFYPCNLRTSHSFGYGFYETRPLSQDFFEADVSMEREGFQLRTRIRIEANTNLADILAARTFIFEADYVMARNQGWLQGAQESSGILLRVGTHGLEVLNGGPLRHAMEPLLHKVLDLVGDLALIRPKLPRLSVRIHNGGHTAHHHLMSRIQQQCL